MQHGCLMPFANTLTTAFECLHMAAVCVRCLLVSVQSFALTVFSAHM